MPPQERSEGKYQLGPVSLHRVETNDAQCFDEQFVQAMAERVESLNLTKADYVIGCPLCLATIPPPSATLSPR